VRLKIAEELFAKMNILRAKEAILEISYVWTKKYDSLKNYFGEGLKRMAKRATRKNIHLHIKMSANLFNASFPSAKDGFSVSALNPIATRMNIHARHIKASEFFLYPYKSNIPVYLNKEETIQVPKGAKVILNANYQHWNEVLKELSILKNKIR